MQALGYGRITVDVRMAEPADFRSLTDWYELGAMTAAQFGAEVRVAVVYDPQRWNSANLSFVETVTYREGLLLRHFVTEQEALGWLTAVTGAP